MFSFISKLRSKSKKNVDKNKTDNNETDGAPEPQSITQNDPIETKVKKPISPKKKKKKTKKKSAANTKNNTKKPNAPEMKPKKNAKKIKSSNKARKAKNSKTTNREPSKSQKNQMNKKKKQKQTVSNEKSKQNPKGKRQKKDKKPAKNQKRQNVQKSITKTDENHRQKTTKEQNHKKKKSTIKPQKDKKLKKAPKSAQNKPDPKSKKYAKPKNEPKDKKQDKKPKKPQQKKKKERTQIKAAQATKSKPVQKKKNERTHSQIKAKPQKKKKASSLSSAKNKKQKPNKKEPKSPTNKTKAKQNKKTKSKETKKAKASKQAKVDEKDTTKKKKKQKQRRNSQIEQDIQIAKRRLSQRSSLKELQSININIITSDAESEHDDFTPKPNDIWSDYQQKFSNEPLNASDLHTFSKTDSRYAGINYKQCRIIFEHQSTAHERQQSLIHVPKEDRDQIYKHRDMKKAKKRRSHIMSLKPVNMKDRTQKDEDTKHEPMHRKQNSGSIKLLLVDSPNRERSRSLSREDASWMTYKSEDDDLSSTELIKSNIKQQKESYLASLVGTNSVEKKKEISKLFDKHIQHAKVNNITSNGEIDADSGINVVNTKKLLERLKDREEAMKSAVRIVTDLGFFKYIKDDDVYGKIYVKRGQIGMDDDDDEEDGVRADFDMFDMNNIDILSKFEGTKRDTLSHVICKAIVSMPTIEIIEMCNADVNDEFLEIFVEYLKEYYMKCKHANISIISIQSNPITDIGMLHLFELIQINNRVLHTIKLQNNRKDISTAVCQQMCESLDLNEFIVKFEFVFRHYQWRDYRDRVVKRNAEKARLQRLALQKSKSI